MKDVKSQVRTRLTEALGTAPQWVLQALAEGNDLLVHGAREEIVNRLIRALEPFEIRPRQVCPYTGNVLAPREGTPEAQQPGAPVAAED
jgi:hypothetical protein